MKTLKSFAFFAVIAMLFSSCERLENIDEEEAPLCKGTIKVVVNTPETKASNLSGDIDRFTATRCDAMTGNNILVSYHGRNGEQIGMVQVINANNGKVISELNTLDARVNYAIYRKDSNGNEVAYVGVDRDDLCGIIAVPMKNYKFEQDANMEFYTPYKVDGISVNCIKAFTGYNNRDILFVAAGGNNALGDNGKAGFTKFGILSNAPQKLTKLAEWTDINYRGYWFSYESLSTHPISYTYRTVNESGNLEYRVGLIQNSEAQTLLNYDDKFFNNVNRVETTVYTNEETNVDMGRFGVSEFNIRWPSGNSNYIVVSTGNKDGGVQVFRHVGADNSLQLVDTWHKACGNTSSLYTSQEDGKYYIYASCGQDGVYKLEVVLVDENTRAIRLEPVGKRVTDVVTENGKLASTNYVQMLNGLVHVAGGYEGYFRLSANSDKFIPADKRID